MRNEHFPGVQVLIKNLLSYEIFLLTHESQYKSLSDNTFKYMSIHKILHYIL